MTRTEFLKKYCLKAAVILALLAVLVYLFSHALGLTKSSLHTTPVRMISDRQVTSATAYLFRDERVLYAEGGGLVDPLVANGAKVGKNVSVARFYPKTATEAEISTLQNAIDKENRYIEILSRSVSVANEPISHANDYRERARLEYLEIGDAVREGHFFDLPSMEEEFLVQLNRYMLLSGKDATLEDVLDTIKAEKEARLGSSYVALKDTGDGEHPSGTFYDHTYVDGYESLFSSASLAKMTCESFMELCEQPTQKEGGTVVGKMIYGYSWYLVMAMDREVAYRFEVGNQYAFSFPENGDGMINFTLERCADGEDSTLMVFSTNDTPSGFDYHRKQTVEITVDHIDGFYVPQSALQVRIGEDGEVQDGVYVFENSVIRFRRIEIVYSGDGYCIVLPPEESSVTELSKNDILVTSGKNLYDGKGY